MKRRWLMAWSCFILTAASVSLIVVCLELRARSGRGDYSQDQPTHQAYVWQRQWTPSLKDSLRQHGHEFERLVVLGAELSFNSAEPNVVYTEADYEFLCGLKRPVGVALRIGPFQGPFRHDDNAMRVIAETVGELLDRQRDRGLEPAEVQIDFDCATSKLRGYRTWLEALRPAVDVPLTFTALPTWLQSREFPELAKASDGFVLQVHSLERPSGPDDDIQLCCPRLALAGVERAGKIGVPFRVALPTYGYVIVFDGKGKFAGVSAGGFSGISPAATAREIRSDPVSIAGLVRSWGERRPDAMRSIIWYRLPTADDTLNWRWSTLSAVMKGQVPRGELVANVESPKPHLWEINLVNVGNADASLDVSVVANWGHGNLVASDALHGFSAGDLRTNRIELRPVANALPAVLPPGEKRKIGWVRVTAATEVQAHVLPSG